MPDAEPVERSTCKHCECDIFLTGGMDPWDTLEWRTVSQMLPSGDWVCEKNNPPPGILPHHEPDRRLPDLGSPTAVAEWLEA